MRNIKLTIEYDGTNYCGWQMQPNGPTVQAVLQKALSKMVGRLVSVVGASRTDAGVHALGQVASFRTTSRISCDGFLKGLNSLLPCDIVVRAAEVVPASFHARKDAVSKHYRYLIIAGGVRPALFKNRAWYIGNRRFDIRALHKEAQCLVGEHDFSSFCASGDSNKTKVRRIDRIDVKDVRGNPPLPPFFKGGVGGFEFISIDIIGGGFLKYMVRNIVGTLFANSQIVMPDPKISRILGARDRKRAGRTAPACGLYLMEVFYCAHPERDVSIRSS